MNEKSDTEYIKFNLKGLCALFEHDINRLDPERIQYGVDKGGIFVMVNNKKRYTVTSSE